VYSRRTMGTRSKTRTVVDLLGAFFRDRTWTQAALADHLALDVKTIRRVLGEMQDAGFPFEREEDHPHVYWSLPTSWLPNAVSVAPEAVRRLLRLVLRLPASTEREALFKQLLTATGPAFGALFEDLPEVHQPEELGASAELLDTIEDATLGRQPLAIRYYSASRGDVGNRTVSPVRISARHRQLLAHCHRRGEPLWFRLDRIQSARVDHEAEYVAMTREQIDAMVAESLGGFAGPGRPWACASACSPPPAAGSTCHRGSRWSTAATCTWSTARRARSPSWPSCSSGWGSTWSTTRRSCGRR
jgi:predicted DNA-binding transcriptional regulator YafY